MNINDKDISKDFEKKNLVYHAICLFFNRAELLGYSLLGHPDNLSELFLTLETNLPTHSVDET